MMIRHLIALTLITGMSLGAQTLNTSQFGNGLLNMVAADSSFAVKFAPRIQLRSYMAATNAGPIDGGIQVRRARLEFDGWVLSPAIRFKFQIGLSNLDQAGANAYNRNSPNGLFDAVVQWRLPHGFQLWVGQTKLPGNLEQLISSSSLQLLERSIHSDYFTLDRDVGIQLHHQRLWGAKVVTRAKFALSQGEGRNVTEGNQGGWQKTARFEFLPMGAFSKKGDFFQGDLALESSPKLMLSYTFNLDEQSVRTRGGKGSYMQLSDGSMHMTDISTHMVDLMVKYRGLSFMGEVARRRAVDPLAIEFDAGIAYTVSEGDGYSAQVGYMLPKDLELAVRVSALRPIYGSAYTDQTIGLSKYLAGHRLKLQTDVTLSSKSGAPAWLIRGGIELHF